MHTSQIVSSTKHNLSLSPEVITYWRNNNVLLIIKQRVGVGTFTIHRPTRRHRLRSVPTLELLKIVSRRGVRGPRPWLPRCRAGRSQPGTASTSTRSRVALPGALSTPPPLPARALCCGSSGTCPPCLGTTSQGCASLL